ncbi:MAG: hypothetical protein AAGI38_04135 [Bacteroidota bacterium]
MDILERIVENLTSDEVRRFKILSNRFKADEEKKLLILFDAIRAGQYKSVEEDVITQLYGDTSSKSKNSYYRLRNKLLSNLEKSLLFYHYNYKNTIESYSNIQLATLFRERGIYKEAFHYLKKAERVAQSYDQFNVLEVIFDAMVQLAAGSATVDMDIEDILKKRKANHKNIEIQRSITEVLAVISIRLNKFNFSRNKDREVVLNMMEEARQLLEEHASIFNSANGKISIYRTVVAILLQKQAYEELIHYIEDTFEDFESNDVFTKETHEDRLKMRIWRVNSLRKLLRLDEEAEQVKLLWDDLKKYKGLHMKQYVFHYYASKAINDQLRGQIDDAGEALKVALETREIMSNPRDQLVIYLSQAGQFFYQELYSRAFDSLQKIFSHKDFEKGLDEEVRFYIAIFDLVNGYESKNYGYVESKYKKFKKKFKKQLKDEYYAKAEKFSELIMRLNMAAVEGRKVFLKSAYTNFVKDFEPSEVADNAIIMYELYLKAKLEEKPYYEVFREHIEENAK